jgi:hypothetical protein
MYCHHCGAAVEPEHRFCAGCGRPLAPGPAAAAVPRGRVQSHLQLLGVLWIVYAGIKLVAGVAVLLVGRVILTRIHLPMEAGFVPDLVTGIGWLILIAGVAGIAAGWGLMQKESWARVLALVLAFFALLNLPLGTALGIYTLWVLLPMESVQEYDQLARRA